MSLADIAAKAWEYERPHTVTSVFTWLDDKVAPAPPSNSFNRAGTCIDCGESCSTGSKRCAKCHRRTPQANRPRRARVQ